MLRFARNDESKIVNLKKSITFADLIRTYKISKQTIKKMAKFQEYKEFNLSQINKDVLAEWDKNDIFRKSLDERAGARAFVFYEGPPSAKGMPGIHHVIARSIKDIFCRYKTMKGYLVNRKAVYAGSNPVSTSLSVARGPLAQG